MTTVPADELRLKWIHEETFLKILLFLIQFSNLSLG